MRAAWKLGTERRFMVEAVGFAVIWVMNLVEIATRFRSMGLMEGLTAGMIFCFAPISMWEAYSKIVGSRDE